LERYAEQLKLKFGSALSDKAQDNKVVSIPGVNGRPPKEISFKNLANIIQCRMEEIIAQVYFEIEASGMMAQLGAGIVLTGGGSLLKNLNQLVAFKTGMEVRVGIPSQSVRSEVFEKVNQPIFSTGVGLMMIGLNDDHNCCSSINKVDPKVEAKPAPETAIEPKSEPKTAVEAEEVRSISGRQKKAGKLGGLFKNLGEFFEVDDEQM
jgi:cell division protein FtsA